MSQNTSSSTMPRTTSNVMAAGPIGADLRKRKVRSFRRRHVYTDRSTEPGRVSATEFAYLQARFGAVPGARPQDIGATSPPHEARHRVAEDQTSHSLTASRRPSSGLRVGMNS